MSDWPTGTGPKVFISYAHESAHHRDQVLELGELLAWSNVRVELDHWAEGERRDWVEWATNLITTADYVLVIASPLYRVAGSRIGKPEGNRGVQIEAAVLRELLHDDRGTWLPKILPLVLPSRSVTELPTFLQPRSASHYIIPAITATGVEPLLRVLTKQPQYVRPEPGVTPNLPPRRRSSVSESASRWMPWRETLAPKRDFLSTLELHLTVDDGQPLQVRDLGRMPEVLVESVRTLRPMAEDREIVEWWSDEMAYALETDVSNGIFVTRDGSRCTWEHSPAITLPSVLNSAVRRMTGLLVGLPLPEPERVTLAAKLWTHLDSPSRLARLRGKAKTEPPVVAIVDGISWEMLRRTPDEYREELAVRLHGAYRRQIYG